MGAPGGQEFDGPCAGRTAFSTDATGVTSIFKGALAAFSPSGAWMVTELLFANISDGFIPQAPNKNTNGIKQYFVID